MPQVPCGFQADWSSFERGWAWHAFASVCGDDPWRTGGDSDPQISVSSMWRDDHGAAFGRHATAPLFAACHRFCDRVIGIHDGDRSAPSSGRHKLGRFELATASSLDEYELARAWTTASWSAQNSGSSDHSSLFGPRSAWT